MKTILEKKDVVKCCSLHPDTKHCCESMANSVNCKGSRIGYTPKFREYYVERNGTSSADTLYYCPWCGQKLPESTRDLLFALLEKEYNIDDDLDNRVPAEFKTDEWWIKRNL